MPTKRRGRRRAFRPSLERLEDRTLPSGGLANPVSGAYTPSQIQTAYGINQLYSTIGQGNGQTVAIIDPFDDPNIVPDTNAFSSYFNLPQFNASEGPTLSVVTPTGDPPPSQLPTGSTSALDETSSDVEWAHAIAPQANILLVEVPTKDAALFGAAQWAASQPGVSVVSMSFGSDEFNTEQSYDGDFKTPSGHQGVTFIASTGDSGSPGQYPAYSPNVLAVGGTTLTLDNQGNYVSETAWSGSGGGTSQYEPEPTYQQGVQNTGQRTIPDVAFEADPNTGVVIYDSAAYGSQTPWAPGPWGGTSLSAPCWAGLIAIADQGSVQSGRSTLDGTTQTIPYLYQLLQTHPADFHDLTAGNNGGFKAGPGYNEVTGLGSPVANRLVLDLAGIPTADLSVVVEGPPTVIAGANATYTITVTNNGPVDTDNFTITDTSSPFVKLVSAEADNSNPNGAFNVTKNGDTATITLPSGAFIKAGESDVFKVVVQIPHTFAAGSFSTNTAAITTSSTTVPDPNLFNNTSTAQNNVTTSADMAILSANGPSTITAGTNATYTVTIKNNGPSDAQNVTVSDVLPTGLIFQATSAAQLSGPDTFTLQGNTLVAATVAAGNTDVLQFFAHAPSNLLPNGKLLTDTATVTTTTTDPTVPDNAQVSSTLATSADLAVTASPPPPVVEGGTITYNVAVANNGPSDAQNVVLSDVLSPDMTLVSANFGAATVSSTGNTITVALGTLSAGNTVTGTIIVQTTEDGNLPNSATVSSTTSDPALSNNTAPVTTAVSEDTLDLTGGVSLTTTEYAALNNVTLATFTHAQAVEPTGAFSALVSWGDGSTSSANVVLSGTTYSVVASHTYNVTGNYSILVTVSEDGASASATDGASIQEAPLPAGLPQSIEDSSDFETIEDGLSQPLSMGQAVSVETSLSSLLLQTVQSLMQQGQAPFLALTDIMAAIVVEKMDDLFHQPISAPQLQSIEMGMLDLYEQLDQSLIQQGQDPGQGLLSSFYLDVAEFSLFATVLVNNGVSLDTAASQMLPSLLLQSMDMIDASTDL